MVSQPSQSTATDVFDIAEKYNREKNRVLNLEEKKRAMLADIYGVEKETQRVVLEKGELQEKGINLNFQLKTFQKK